MLDNVKDLASRGQQVDVIPDSKPPIWFTQNPQTKSWDVFHQDGSSILQEGFLVMRNSAIGLNNGKWLALSENGPDSTWTITDAKSVLPQLGQDVQAVIPTDTGASGNDYVKDLR